MHIAHIVGFILIGLLGIVAQILIKVRALRRRSQNLVVNVSLTKYLLDEWDNILLSVLALIIAGACYDQAVDGLSPVVAGYIVKFSNPLFITVGYMGASLLSNLLGKTESLVNKEIDSLATKSEL